MRRSDLSKVLRAISLAWSALGLENSSFQACKSLRFAGSSRTRFANRKLDNAAWPCDFKMAEFRQAPDMF
jgi:hypothetical protein